MSETYPNTAPPENFTPIAPGHFCWWEHGTTDQAGARAFYSTLLGWTTTDMPLDTGDLYIMAHKDGKDLAGLYPLNDEQVAQGIPPHWMPHIAVADADATAAAVKAHGGTVVFEPFDVMEAGRLAFFQDPTGAMISVWQGKEHMGAQIAGEPGSVCWNELATRDAAAARAFYAGVFGWEAEVLDMDGMPYTMFSLGDQQVGGMMEMDETWGEAPPAWSIYFAVDDADAATQQAQDLGGSVVVPLTDIPGTGRFSVLTDPAGGVFSVIKLDPPQA